MKILELDQLGIWGEEVIASFNGTMEKVQLYYNFCIFRCAMDYYDAGRGLHVS
jgi:hypothetical protein